jgi:DNA-binding LacI/PurR family transcriptional regulator
MNPAQKQPQNIPVHSYNSKVDSLVNVLQKELVQGIWPWNEALPLIKELSARWNCHPQTVRKVLQTLIQKQLLKKQGRLHYPSKPKSGSGQSDQPVILCIGAASPDGHFRLDSDRESDFWRELSSQAALAGLALRRLGWQGQKIKIDRDVIGVVTTTWHFPDPMAVCREVSKANIPVCVWIEEHILDAPHKFPKLFFHDQGYSTLVGSSMGDYLLKLGHKKLAFLSPWHASKWSKNRFQGVLLECEKQGAELVLCKLDYESEWDHLIPATTHPKMSTEFPIGDLDAFMEGSGERTIHWLKQELGWNRIRIAMEPILQEALQSGATAWLGANDFVALHARVWLNAKGIQTPEHISIAGFDDSVEALRSDLTSYRFTCETMARAMITQIVTGSSASKITRHQGVVVPRHTTACLIPQQSASLEGIRSAKGLMESILGG